MTAYLKLLRQQARSINWILLAFLLLLLNVKLVVKLVAFLLILLSRHRKAIRESILSQKYLYFYFSMILIGLVNLVLVTGKTTPQIVATAFGISTWVICLLAALFIHHIIQAEKKQVLFNTLALFFLLHAAAIFLNLFMIMIECGTLNPYTFKGFNQKYYISTGDYISGITFDSPVTTAMISAFGVVYFLYQRRFAFSLISMAGMVLIASNLTNILLVAVLLFIFIAKTDRLQKSIIVLQVLVLVIFIGKISPQNTEYTGRFAYKMLGLTYDKPKSIITPDFIRKQPDSLLGEPEKRKKIALQYIDSISAERKYHPGNEIGGLPVIDLPDKSLLVQKPAPTTSIQFKETPEVKAKVHRFSAFMESNYDTAERASLSSAFTSKLPGKWIAFKEIIAFFKTNPNKIFLGAGTGNFSSRVAFKTTGLGIAGGYPAKYIYIHPTFRKNHLFLYLYYHAQEQNKHAAENTPDSTYGQIASEYGLAGMLAFIIFYCGNFFRQRKYLSYGLGISLLLLGGFFTEYWFEQLSVVVLAETLLFLDIKTGREKFNIV